MTSSGFCLSSLAWAASYSLSDSDSRLRGASLFDMANDGQSWFELLCRVRAYKWRRRTHLRSMLVCQVFLALTQTAFVLGAVYFKYSVNHEDQVHQINPVVFAFIREAIAGTVLCCLAYLSTRSIPKKEDLSSLAFVGILMYFNQLFYILGVELSGVVVATCIQPAIPVFTAALAISLGKEEPSISKTIGILLASAGSICMVRKSDLPSTETNFQVAGGAEVGMQSAGVTSDVMLGNILLLLNTVAMALYYIYAKPMMTQYPPMSVAAWAYVTAAFCMGCTALWYNRYYQHAWYLPQEAYGPLAYWIVICSVCGYTIIAWGMKHLPSTQVSLMEQSLCLSISRSQRFNVCSLRSERHWVLSSWVKR